MQRSTIDQIIRLQDDINKIIHNSWHTLGLCLDFEKAFDLIWHEGLLIKLRKLGLNGHICNWIKDFCNQRTIQVRIGSNTTAHITIYTAVIRPVIDYADVTYNSSPTSYLQKLDQIQAAALKTCVGATKNTPTISNPNR
jgi:hypothetical protein